MTTPSPSSSTPQQQPSDDLPAPVEEPPSALGRARRALFGAPRDVRDPGVFHKIPLVAFLAWVGLGSDGLSSSAYGPAEGFRNLIARNPVTGRMEGQWYLAVGLAAATVFTVFIISYAYSRVIEHFPHGGGGYVVATKLLGDHAGVVSGCALLVDYVLTITVSIAAGGDALFNLLPDSLAGRQDLKVGCEAAVLLVLILLNLRGVKESVKAIMPIFLVFVATHIVLIVGGLASHGGDIPHVVRRVGSDFHHGLQVFGGWKLFTLFIRAFSLGGGTFTGIEAVSNGLAVMRDPKVQTGKRTMLYMATSLAFTAGGIMLCYLLFNVQTFFELPEGEQLKKTLNWVLADKFAGHWRIAGLPVGSVFVSVALASEAALLFLAAQTGFIDGPRVMSNMAVDSWLPHRFASLSDRLTTKDGVLLMGVAAILLLAGTRGRVDALVVMYSINVFATFSLTQLAMCRFWFGARARDRQWLRHIGVHIVGLVVCMTILFMVIIEKFAEGAWMTLVITCTTIALCIAVRSHYRSVARQLRQLDDDFRDLPVEDHHGGEPVPTAPTAALLVGQYGGAGIHSLLWIQKMFPGYFKNVVFVSAAVIDSGSFKGAEEIDALQQSTRDALARYVALARQLGWSSASAMSVGTDRIDELYKVCIDLSRHYPRLMFFGGKLIWQRESWWQRILHNETSHQIQRRLQWKGLPMSIIPLRTGIESKPKR